MMDVDSLYLSTLEKDTSKGLVRSFLEEEIKQAVWDCVNFKSPNPDGVNVGFFYEFWVDIKAKCMCFIGEFESSGRLVKCANSTFIVLITKKDNPQGLNHLLAYFIRGMHV